MIILSEIINKNNKKYMLDKIIIPDDFKIKGGKIYAFFKRLFDIIASLIAIIVLSWLLIIIAILVKCTSRGPAIYASQRVGKNGKIFKMYKFRSMYKDADARLNELLKYNETQGITFKMKNDPRVTKFGKFLRKSSLDELPQLFNIFLGQMSIIGPRAAIPREVEQYDDKMKLRLLVPQGLSGEWQTHGRSKTTFNDMINMDLEYIEKKRSFFYDIYLIFKTIFQVIFGRGAE